MHWINQLGPDLVFTREYLKAGVFVSLLSVWVLVALFYYLNRYTKRRYFTIWTAAWLFYALWITLSFGVQVERHSPFLMMLQQWCVGVSAIFLLLGSLRFLGEKINESVFGWLIAFLFVWSYFGAYHMHSPLELEVPVFSLIGIASAVTSASFFRYRSKHSHVGATLLTLGFFLWGAYMVGYPFLENSEDLTSVALFISAGLQLLLAVSMIILVLEEARDTQTQVLEEVQIGRAERFALQTRVESTEQRYQKLFDQASEALIITDAITFKILELNQAAERLLGITRAETGRDCLTTFCQLNQPEASMLAPSGEWFQKLCRQRPVNLKRKNGSLVPVEVNGTQIEFDGKLAYQFFISELTERARLEQQLRQSEKLSAIGQMISGVAHELNNPLAVVKGYLELVLSHHELQPQTRIDLEKAAHESNRAAKLVMNFLAFARQQPSRRETLQVNDFIRRVVDLRKSEIETQKAEIVLELDPQLPQISANADQIHQSITNLMNNSLQAMAEVKRPACLRFKTSGHGDFVRLIVEDNGPGVPPHLVTKIFEPFFTTKDVGVGTGLGLSIVHSLTTEHRGRLYYQTSELGGAGFVLELPVPLPGDAIPKPEAATTFITKPVAVGPAQQGKILVLDDEKGIAEMLGEMLGLLGYTTTICHLATDALHLIDKRDFDLIISDFRMPEMNGREFFERAVEKRLSLARRIVFVTGDVVNEETSDFLKSTGNPHIAKPFNLGSVKNVVANVLNENRALAA